MQTQQTQQTQQLQQDAFDASPLAFIACSRCRRDFLAQSTDPDPAAWFYLTVCAHTVCARCTFPSGPPLGDLSALQVACPACRTAGPLARLATDASSELDHCFRPLGVLLAELGMAAKWQVYNLTEHLAFFKAKCQEQKKALGKLSGEINKIKALKAQNVQLSAENASLRQQLSATTLPAQQSTRMSYDHAHGQHGAFSEQENDPSSDAGSRGQKRKPRSSPDRASLPLRPAMHSTFPSTGPADLALHHLPMQPPRLSLTPQHAKKHEQVRQRQQSARAVFGGQGAWQGQGSVEQGERDGRSFAQRLSDFAYNPSRASQRATPAPARTLSQAPHQAQAAGSSALSQVGLTSAQLQHRSSQPGPPQSGPFQSSVFQTAEPPQQFSYSSHEEQEHRQPFSTSPNPFFYNPPPLNQHPRQQQDDPDTALMPPPPLPASRSVKPYSSHKQLQPDPKPHPQHQQLQPRFSSTPVPSSSRASSAFTPSQVHAQNSQAPPTPSFSGLSEQRHSQAAPKASFAVASSYSHRQPFRPAGSTPFGSGTSQQFARGR